MASNTVILSVTNKPIMLSVIMLNVAMLSVVMLNVVARGAARSLIKVECLKELSNV